MGCLQHRGPDPGGVVEVWLPQERVQLASIKKVCGNPKCEISERDPDTGYIPIENGACKRCGHPAAMKPGSLIEEGLYE